MSNTPGEYAVALAATAASACGYTRHNDQLIKRLHRIEGLVRGITKVVDDDRYCIDILQQLSASAAKGQGRRRPARRPRPPPHDRRR
jgi:hypothetical protein